MTLYTNQDSIKDGYHAFEASLQTHFDKAVATGRKLFVMHVEGLYELYLSKLPETKEGVRQHYTCHACRQFLERFGGLVTIDEDGIARSAIFDENIVPDFFVDATIAMRHAVLTQGRVTGVFIPDARVAGTPKTGEWTHMHIKLPSEMTNKSVLKSSYQVQAAKREDYNVLSRVSQQYTLAHVDQAIALLKSETVYRGDRYVPAAEWFRNVMIKLSNLSGNSKRNYLWLAAANAPTGFIPTNSSNVGQLLGDIADGLSPAEAGAKLAQRLDPRTFQRAQAAPKANAIKEHERIFARYVDAGIVKPESLERRYADITEIPLTEWASKGEVKKAEPQSTGVFGHLTPRDSKVTAAEVNLPTKVMTWEKFKRTVLESADKIEALVDNPARFMALVTALHPDAPNMLLWDNTFSWYYHGGADADIRRRLEEYGAKYEDNEIRASLAWEGLTDLDFHCITPYGERIMFNSKTTRRCTGYLDLDMNGLDKRSETPVENIRWSSNAPEGNYRFIVHNYSERVNRMTGTPFKVELEINGKIYAREFAPLRDRAEITVFEFYYKKGQAPVFKGSIPASADAWGVESDKFVEVTGITTSPNLWGEHPMPRSGTHIFFLLKDVKDEAEGKGRGFFNEMLKSEFREIRKTLEHYTASAVIQGAEDATACGVGYSKEHEWNLTLKVTSAGISQIVKIDRWD